MDSIGEKMETGWSHFWNSLLQLRVNFHKDFSELILEKYPNLTLGANI